ncbi:phosphatidylinositol mannoside acyltransferase [Dermatobacter hominis]|uniref:phosphatidylinositol mannoside acyltransferase n=1 Tax=Dermatobacter hominis TaxID=2884263 RepID=UPI001D1195B1|nr:phosphatidylinositol mannoside acyltransferase [Dermatobacter hominis]UDY36146.1 phosphatidylinositol mannoside acyltransferase [Dermatobacter hominis]
MELSVGGLRLASRLVRAVPGPVGAAAASALGRLAVPLSGDQRLIAERNMRRALGPDASDAQIRRAVRQVFQSYARYWFDTLRLPALTPTQVADGISIEGLHHLTEAIDRGVGPILALPHVGGWEWAGRYLGTEHGWNVSAVAEKLEPPELYEWFLDLRDELGMRIIPLGPSAGSESAKALADGDVMCLLCDRDLAGSGIEVGFFGERTTLPGGPALMALRSGSPLLPTAVYFRGSRCHGVVEAPLDTERRGRLRDDVERVTQDLAHALERLIRIAPEQWHLLQPNWPSDLVALGLDDGVAPSGAEPTGDAEGRPAASR